MLKLQYFGHLMWRTDSLEKTLMLGKTEKRRRRDNRGWDGWMASPTQCTRVWASSGSWWWTGKPGMLQSMGSQSDTTEQLNWTEKIGGLDCSNIDFCFFGLFSFQVCLLFSSMDFPGGSDGKASAYNAGDPGSIPGSGSPGEGNGKPLQYSCLENPMDREAW